MALQSSEAPSSARRTVLEIARRLVGLRETSSRVLFSMLVVVDVAFKVLLGLVLTLDNGYGFSFVSPPFSLLLAASDVVISYAFVWALEKLVPARALRAAQIVVFAAMAVFLVFNYTVHVYFKSFATYGLIEFNGASVDELAFHFMGAVDGLFVAFMVVVAVLLAVFAFSRAAVSRLDRPRSPLAAPIAAACAGAIWAALGPLGWDQTGRLVRNPVVDMISSVAEAIVIEGLLDEGEVDLAGFDVPRAPVFGAHVTGFDGWDRIPALSRPNVLLVTVESLPYLMTPEGGDARSPLSVLDALGNEAIVFTSYRTVFPATSRSLIAQHCAVNPDTAYDTITRYMPDFECAPFTKVLADAGWETGFFTASMLTYDNLDKAGFMRHYGVVEDYFTFKDRSRHARLTARAVEEEVVVDRLLEFMTQDREGAPFFAHYFTYWTHSPYHLPADDLGGMKPLDRYYATQRYLNETLTDLLSRMERASLMDDTVVIVTADHGEGFGLHHANYNHSSHVYEDTVKVPLIIRIPGLDERLENARSVSNVDFGPTLLALLGLASPPGWEGRSAIGEAFEPRPHLVYARSTHLVNGIVDGNYKYFYYLNHTGMEHFYDIAADPLEQRNLIGAHGDEAARYKALVRKWLAFEQGRITGRLLPAPR